MAMDWLSSDRPPLQTGIVLSQYPFMPRPRELGYTVVSVIAQSLWIFGLWLLLSAVRIKPRAIALVLLTCLLTGFIFVNSFFVWPKLLAAAYLLGLMAALSHALIDPISLDRKLFIVTSAALLAWGMLSHGASFFAVIGIGIVSLPFIKRVSVKRIAVVLGLAFLLYLPWMGYQNFFDPPGNRMLKYHLAGEMAVDQRSFGEALIAAYSELSFKQVLAYKIENFDAAAGRGFDYCRHLPLLVKDLIRPQSRAAELPQLAGVLRGENFFFLWACLGCLIVGPFLLSGRDQPPFPVKRVENRAALLDPDRRYRNSLVPAHVRPPHCDCNACGVLSDCFARFCWIGARLLGGKSGTCVHRVRAPNRTEFPSLRDIDAGCKQRRSNG